MLAPAAGRSMTAAGSGWGAGRGAPHSEQNISPGMFVAPQLGHTMGEAAATGPGA